MLDAERRWELGYLKGHLGGLRVRVDSRRPYSAEALRRPHSACDALRAAILAGDYEPIEEDPTRNELPGAVELGAKYGVATRLPLAPFDNSLRRDSSWVGLDCDPWWSRQRNARTARQCIAATPAPARLAA
jgi:hypothetical protein